MRVKSDWAPQPGEVVEDAILIRADKNPNTAGARSRFPTMDEPAATLPEGCDLVLAWGEGFDVKRVPRGARLVVLDAWRNPDHASADVFIPISIQTERDGAYTNFQGVTSGFKACFAKPASVEHAAEVFGKLAAPAPDYALRGQAPAGAQLDSRLRGNDGVRGNDVRA